MNSGYYLQDITFYSKLTISQGPVFVHLPVNIGSMDQAGDNAPSSLSGSSSGLSAQSGFTLEQQLASIASAMQDMNSAMQSMSRKHDMRTDEGGEEVASKRVCEGPEDGDDDGASLINDKVTADQEDMDILAEIDQGLDDKEPLGPQINDKLTKKMTNNLPLFWPQKS